MPARPEAAPARALAWLYAPGTLRAPLAALFAIEREIGSSLRAGLDHQIAHARLTWWREECARCAQGEAVHPRTRELAAALAGSAEGALADLTALVDTAVWDLACATFESRAELQAYCARWSAAMIAPLAALSGAGASALQLRTLGRSLRELELLLALAPDARLGRLRLPLDELERAGATAADLARPPWSAGLATLVGARHRELRGALAASVNGLAAPAQAALRGVVVWAAMVATHSRRAERRLPHADATHDRHAPLDGWRAWRAARRAAAGRGLSSAD